MRAALVPAAKLQTILAHTDVVCRGSAGTKHQLKFTNYFPINFAICIHLSLPKA
jgi:hypothetical protein